MAELRTIQRAEIRDIRQMRSLLALSDCYSVIPYPLSSLKLKAVLADPNILVLGPTGLFLISYHLVYSSHGQPPPHFIDAVRDLEHSAELLQDYLQPHNLSLPVFALALVVEDGNIQGPVSENVSLIAWSKLQEYIQGRLPLLADDQIKAILEILQAKPNFQRIFCYQILAEMERSSKHTNYKAINIKEDRPVLLKEIRVPPSLDSLEKNPLIRGAKLAQDLNHENIIRIEKLFPQEDRIFIVSEWCEGGITLQQYLEEQEDNVPLTSAIQLMKDLCSALIYAHDRGVIHRNVTPENLIVTPEHRLKVSNFGLAKRSGMVALQTVDSLDLRKLTQENPYAAPEYILGTYQVDQRVDVYAAGIIFYELLTGRLPTHYDEQLWEPPSKIIPGLPTYMDTLIAKAIRFDRNQRYSTMHAFYSALEKGAGELIHSRYEILDTAVPKESENSLLYKAMDTKTDQVVALKKLLVAPNIDRQTRLRHIQAILDNAKKMKTLTHPSLVSIYDTFIEDDDGYIVMEWVEGRNLREILDDYPPESGLPYESVCHMALQIAEVLQYIHHEGYLHGDIKPENCMGDSRGKITLLDCGLVKPGRLAGERKGPSGTLRYMAPELFQSDSGPSEKTDVFALGVLLYELLTHRFPYDNTLWLQEGGMREEQGRPPAPAQLNSSVPPRLDRVILKALHLNPHERYETMETLLHHLEASLAPESDAGDHLAEPHTLHTPAPLQHWLERLALVALGAMGLYLGYQLIDARIQEPPPIIQEVFSE